MLTPTAAEAAHAPADAAAHPPAPSLAGLTRRVLVARSAGLAGFWLAGMAPAAAQPAEARPTAEDALGPFYPLTLPADQDADLTVVQGQAGRAKGQLLYVTGRVLTPRGQPLAGAVIEIWQANAAGRYAHPGDDNAAPLDPAFQGYAKIRTDAEGRYRFKTVKPGEYGGRTPHIHFDVRGGSSRLVTQMYFEGEARNETDGLLKNRSAGAKRTLVSRYAAPGSGMERDALVAAWDVVLAFG